MNLKTFRRRYRLQLFRLGRLGKLRLLALLAILVCAIGLHLTVAVRLADEQPGDSKVYVQLARNIIEQGVFSSASTGPYAPTLIRMPGYPLFLAGVFEIGGLGNVMAVRVVQSLLFSLTCLLVAFIASEWIEERRSKPKAFAVAFVLAAFCPFMAIYSAVILTETVTMFLLAATILSATYAIKTRTFVRSAILWGISGLMAGTNVLFRPDAGLFAFGLGLTIAFSIFWGRGGFTARIWDRFKKGIVFSAMFAVPLVPWTIRNERVFGVFQPLAPAHAEMPGETVPLGYYAWLRTWLDDSKYIDPLIWRLEINRLRIEDVPQTAFSSDEEKQKISALFDRYNNSDPEHPFIRPRATPDDSDSSDDDDDAEVNDQNDAGGDETSGDHDAGPELDLKITPEVDAEFAAIAAERIEAHPWRYYLVLPAKRAATMWFDTHSDSYPFNGELFPLTDLDESQGQQYWLPLFGALTILYTMLSFGGLFILLLRRGRPRLWFFLVLAISLPRILFFGTIENPEPRYFVELFIPATILGAIFLACTQLTRGTGAVGVQLDYQGGQEEARLEPV